MERQKWSIFQSLFGRSPWNFWELRKVFQLYIISSFLMNFACVSIGWVMTTTHQPLAKTNFNLSRSSRQNWLNKAGCITRFTSTIFTYQLFPWITWEDLNKDWLQGGIEHPGKVSSEHQIKPETPALLGYFFAAKCVAKPCLSMPTVQLSQGARLLMSEILYCRIPSKKTTLYIL